MHSEPGTEDGIFIELQPPNPLLAAYLQLSLARGAEDSWIQFRQEGRLHLEPQEFDSLSIHFEFCPERFTIIPVTKGHSSFSIRPEESLFEMFLSNFSLTHTGEALKGRHPMMEGEFEYGRG